MSQPNPEEILALAREQIARRRAAEPPAAAPEAPWRPIFWASLAGLTLAFLLWPGHSLDWKLYAAVHGLVAQKHNVFLGGEPLPVCARNIGIYGSYLISLAYLFARGHGRAAALPGRPLLALLGLFAAAMVFDGVNSVLEDTGRSYLYLPRNDLRTITGILFGVALTPIALFVFNRALRADAERARPVLGWADLAALLLLNGLLFAAVYSGAALLYWPLAIFSVIALLGEMFTIILMLIAVALGYTRRVTALAQLARPGTFALLATALLVGGLAILRFSLEA